MNCGLYTLKNTKLFYGTILGFVTPKKWNTFAPDWRGVRVVEGARLESVYTPKVYRGFESLSLRQSHQKLAERLAFLFDSRQKLAFVSEGE